MKIKVVAVGKLKEKYLRDGIAEYAKRLGAYTKVEIIEAADERIPDKASEAICKQVKDREGERLLKHIASSDYVILLAVQGQMMDSIAFSRHLERQMTQGASTITFVIGGSLGHSDAIAKRADFQISFSQMTFPHQLMRLILMEQIYRAFKIMKNETYHK